MLSDDRPGIYRKICKGRDGIRTKTRERSDGQSPADWSGPDQTRERTDWQSADWDNSDEARKAMAWQSPFSWQ